MKFVVILSIAVALIIPVYSTTFFYAFKCKSNDDNSTMTHESHLQQPNGNNDMDKLGYQAGSFSYLQKGKIIFKDMIGYKLWRFRDPAASEFQRYTDVFYNMNISFEGSKGISEFYADGSFLDSKTISSKNAIRFEEISQKFSKNFNNYSIFNYSAKKINVSAYAVMCNSPKRDLSYNFLYNATVANGVVETKRVMRSIDGKDLGGLSWEQTSMMKGNITLADSLSASNFLGS